MIQTIFIKGSELTRRYFSDRTWILLAMCVLLKILFFLGEFTLLLFHS